MFPHSIRWRLQLWLGFLLVCLLSGFGIAVFQLYRTHQFARIDEDLERETAMISASVRGRPPFEGGGPGGPLGRGFRGRPPPEEEGPEGRRPGPPGGPWNRGGPDGPGPRDLKPWMRDIRLSPEVLSRFGAERADRAYFGIWSRNGTLLKAATNAPASLRLPAFAKDTRTRSRSAGEFREAYQFTEMGECVLVGRSIAADLAAIRGFGWWLTAAAASLLGIGLGGGWWLTTRAIRPIEEMSAAARRISAGNLAERITGVDATNELGRLAAVLNSTFSRLEAAFSRQRQFTADASHELRTPLAVLISEAQMTLARERTAGEYKEAVENCLEIAQQLRRLTESLLDLARSDAAQDQQAREPVKLHERAEFCLTQIQQLAESAGVTAKGELQPATALAHAMQIDQVIINLLSNAIHYNRPGGKVWITTCETATEAVLSVRDTGLGISEEDLPHIFERFYRADKSRSRSSGHFGLGLAICQAIVESNDGSISATSELGKGTTFTVRLPRGG